ncbi:MAG: hypothetical protein M1825_003661 [Sarcosagium campestre]|nr:MAG: hypothetical protein M1825_003661 [Sarcosagium campestre]
MQYDPPPLEQTRSESPLQQQHQQLQQSQDFELPDNYSPDTQTLDVLSRDLTSLDILSPSDITLSEVVTPGFETSDFFGEDIDSSDIFGDDIADTMKNLSLNPAARTAVRQSARRQARLAAVQDAPPQLQSPKRRPANRTAVEQRAVLPALNTARTSPAPARAAAVRTSPGGTLSRKSSVATLSRKASAFKSPEVQTPQPLTPATVARSFFSKDLQLHESEPIQASCGTTVILHDSCYGHRFSRPRTSKASLRSIVERPERIHASILGLAAAYVRLGGRHAEGSFPPSLLPGSVESAPFRIQKSTRSISLTSPVVTNVHGVGWMEELKALCDASETKLALNGKELDRPKVEGALDTPKAKLHEGDLYLCGQSLDALQGSLGAVCDGVDAVFGATAAGAGPSQPRGSSKAFVCIRPPGHHCASSHPSGFCWLNNVHVGISHASLAHGLTHAAIIDFDLHHGDGSQSIAWAHNAKVARHPRSASSAKKAAIGYFSIHDINSYPCEMGDEEKVRNASLCIENAHGQSTWNVHLQPWKTEDEFWQLYESRYLVLLDKARAFLRLHTQRLRSSPNQPPPRAAIFLSAGFDASEWEGAGMQRHKVNVPTEFYARFTRDVVRLSAEEDLGVDGRIVSVLEGGYSDRALCSGVLGHVSALAGAEYSPAWWAKDRLEELERLVDPPTAPSQPPRRPRNAVPPTYTSSTQSFDAKIVSSPKSRRSLSGTSASGPVRSPSANSPSMATQSATPPDVDWATASYELSRLLIPADRQTKSCAPEDLSAETTRSKKQGLSLVDELPVPTSTAAETRMTLRDRKVRAPNYAVDGVEDPRPISRSAGRRRTLAGAEVLAEKADAGAVDVKVTRRRSSAASSVSSIGDGLSGSRTAAATMTEIPPVPVLPIGVRANAVERPAVKSTSRPTTSGSGSDAKSAKKSAPSSAAKPSSKGLVAVNGGSGSGKDPSAIDQSGAGVQRIKLHVRAKEDYEAEGNDDDRKLENRKPVARAPRKPAVVKASKAGAAKKGSGAAQVTATSRPATPAAAARKRSEKKPAKATTSRPTTPGPTLRKKRSDDAVDVASRPASPERPLRKKRSGQAVRGKSRPASPLLANGKSDAANKQSPPPNASLTKLTILGGSPKQRSGSPSRRPAAAPESDASLAFIPFDAASAGHAPLPPSLPLAQEGLTWLPPNTATPISNTRRFDLPVFTASSPIPFGTGGHTAPHNALHSSPGPFEPAALAGPSTAFESEHGVMPPPPRPRPRPRSRSRSRSRSRNGKAAAKKAPRAEGDPDVWMLDPPQ